MVARWRAAGRRVGHRGVPLCYGDLAGGALHTTWGSVESLAFSFDGTLLGTQERGIQVWWVADGSFVYELKGYSMLAASPTTDLWAGFAAPGGVKLWRASDGQLVREIPRQLRGILATLAISHDGQLVVVGMAEVGGFEVLRVADGGLVSKAQGDSGWWDQVFDAAFHPNGTTFAAVGTDDLLAFWDAKSGTMIRQLTGPNDFMQNPVVTGVTFAPDGSVFATTHSGGPGRESGTVQLWQTDGTHMQLWQTGGQPNDTAFSPDSTLLAAADEQTIYLWRPSDGSLVRSIQPVWHQGILPTLTPTPLHVELKVPADWKEYLEAGYYPHFRLRYPPQWLAAFGGSGGVTFLGPSPSGFDDKSAMILDLSLGGCARKPPGDPETVEQIKKDSQEMLSSIYLWRSGERVFVTGGKWPLLIPGTYAEFDTTTNVTGRGPVRVIQLITWPESGSCATAFLIDELQDISEEGRLDLSRVLASIEFEDPQHPFPTTTPTFTRTPNPVPTPALPLQIKFSAKTSREGGRANADVVFEIRDAFGNPVNGAIVTVDGFEMWELDGRYEMLIDQAEPPTDQTVTIEVRWNDELTAKEDFVVPWQ